MIDAKEARKNTDERIKQSPHRQEIVESATMKGLDNIERRIKEATNNGVYDTLYYMYYIEEVMVDIVSDNIVSYLESLGYVVEVRFSDKRSLKIFW